MNCNTAIQIQSVHIIIIIMLQSRLE